MTTHHRLPADYTRCVNEQCVMRIRCLRWLCREDNMRSSFAIFPPWPKCGAWLPATTQPTEPTTEMKITATSTPKSILYGLENCPLHRKTPFGVTNVSMTQLSIARYYGGIKYNGEDYTYHGPTDELIRDDVLKWKKKQEKQQPTEPTQPK